MLLWRRMAKKQRIRLRKNRVLPCLNKAVYIGKARAVITEATEIIRASRKTTTHVKIVKAMINFKAGIPSDKPHKTPRVVAMPLPPLNPKKTVQLWPQMQAIPRMMRMMPRGRDVTLGARKFPKNTIGKKPLRTSMINTVIPTGLPRTRMALVAPTLPEPNLRISMPSRTRPKM